MRKFTVVSVLLLVAASVPYMARAGESDSPLQRIRDLEAGLRALADRVAALEGTRSPAPAPPAPGGNATEPSAVQRLRDLEAGLRGLTDRVTALERSATAPKPAPPAARPTPAGPVDGRLQGIPPAKDYGRKHLIQREYDKFSDTTAFTLKLSLRSSRNVDVKLTAFWSASGQNPRYAPRLVGLMFTRSQEQWEWLDYHKVSVLTGGGERYSVAGRHSGDTIRGGVIEHVSFSVDVEKFLDIVNSAEFDVRIGLDDLHLSGDLINALRDLASRMPAEVAPR